MENTAKPQKSWVISEAFKTTISLVVVLLAIGFAIVLYNNRPKPKNRASSISTPTVVTATLQTYTGNLDLTVSGTVVPYREISLAAEVSGVITEVHTACEPGGFVIGGTPLMVIDPESYQLEVRTGEAEVAQSKNTITETEKELEGLIVRIALSKREVELLQSELERNTRLGTVISASELDQVKRTLLGVQAQLVALENNQATALARLERAKSGLELAMRRLERAQLNVSKTHIVAPDTGVIVRRHTEQGNFVSVGTPLITFEVTRRAEVICNLSMTDLNWIRQNAGRNEVNGDEDPRHAYQLPRMNVKVFDPNDPGYQWDGILERFDGIGLDSQTKTIPVRIVVDQPILKTPNRSRALVRGMFVKCRIETPRSAIDEVNLMIVPAKAIRTGGVLWTVENSKLKQHRVEVVSQISNPINSAAGETEKLAVIKRPENGLQPGALVVVSPLGQPSEGTEVVLITAEETGSPTRLGGSEATSSESDEHKIIDEKNS
ncbi:MAG: HlyD family efflux transporter periplasmic adaptor subunit [Pirellulaceae bacterium]|nr:HlyD family efflux transporter periplasmic adaptor subunit [Pirellulaceae bacterium]